HGRRREAMSIETLTHLSRGATEEAAAGEAKRRAGLLPAFLRSRHAERVGSEELDLLISQPGDHRERSVEIALQRFRHGEQPDADAAELIGCSWRRRGSRGSPASGRERSGSNARGRKELASGLHGAHPP